MKRPSHRTGKVACQYKRIPSSVSTHSNDGRKLHVRSKRKKSDTIKLIKLSETICVTIKEGKINQMLQVSIVFTLRWVGPNSVLETHHAPYFGLVFSSLCVTHH